MADSGITAEEIHRLEAVKEKYVSGRLSLVASTAASTVAFSLATLSSSRIAAQVNFWITVLVLLGFLLILYKTKRGRNPLVSSIRALEEKYPEHAATRKFLDEQNIWKGFGEEKVTVWLGTLLSAVFVCYALIEHTLRAFF